MQIASTFKDTFGYSPARSNFTPGRVNLIGEHIDYNGGLVLPTALSLGTWVSFKPRTDKIVRIFSDQFDVVAERFVDDKASDHWSDYALGAVKFAYKAGFINGGADLALQSNLPFSAGLSSSSALTVGILKLARDHAGSDMSDTEIAKMARHVENDFIGMPCGIMDQMAVAIAQSGQALALNTETLDYGLIDLPRDYHMAVLHTGQYRRNADGNYKARKEDCDVVKADLGTENICQISDAQFNSLSTLDAVYIRRARHCMSEHRRTVAAATALKHKDMVAFGHLMNASHASMRDDFEISLPAIDSLVEDAASLGAMGARLTGGGFGGCIVACVHVDALDQWQEKLLEKHPAAFAVA